ncbi:MAG: glutamate--tRNA ligase [Clostridiales bacterium]|jgi:glutamyl-tRNA synthetase|nr:glutamate--tRNA ligase [Clostridiales bacterium]
MDLIKLADRLYPDITTFPEDMEKRYPKRNLPADAKVTRFAPSPTGFVHFGSLLPTRVSERLAHQSGGVMFLRIEDTDSKRYVEGAVENMIKTYDYYNIKFDEGATIDGDVGDYGPYRQSERKEIYQTYAKQLIREGKAYPCFCTAEELDEMRAQQEALDEDPGYYGKWAKWRDASDEDIEAALDGGIPFALRFRSEGNPSRKINFTDLVKGEVTVSENFIDHVILKSDGIPTYHFAHAVDDQLMGTTHVVRGEEWLPSLPFHIQLFKALGFRLPKYLHISQLMKLEDGNKKKLSKRDNEAAVSYFTEKGYSSEAVVEYIMTLLNSNYEEWRAANPDKPYTEFPFNVKKMSPSGCLFDEDKLNDVSRNTVSRMTADKVYNDVTEWAEHFDPELYSYLTADREKAIRIFSIGRGGKKPRKDITIWGDVKDYVSLFYDSLFKVIDQWPEEFSKSDIKAALESFIESYNPADDQSAWFDKIKVTAAELGFAPEMKQYKSEPEKYKGSVADISMFIRIAVTGRINSPDLYEIMSIIGAERVKARISAAVDSL